MATIEFRSVKSHSTVMSTKEIVQDLLQRLPENVSLHDIAQEIEFVAAIRHGIDELNRGELIPIEQVEEELQSWVIRQPSHHPLAGIYATLSDTSHLTPLTEQSPSVNS